jgi:hypothetical protein
VGNADIVRFFCFSFIYSENVHLYVGQIRTYVQERLIQVETGKRYLVRYLFTASFSLPFSFCSYSLRKRCDAHENNSDELMSSSNCV